MKKPTKTTPNVSEYTWHECRLLEGALIRWTLQYQKELEDESKSMDGHKRACLISRIGELEALVQKVRANENESLNRVPISS